MNITVRPLFPRRGISADPVDVSLFSLGWRDMHTLRLSYLPVFVVRNAAACEWLVNGLEYRAVGLPEVYEDEYRVVLEAVD